MPHPMCGLEEGDVDSEDDEEDGTANCDLGLDAYLNFQEGENLNLQENDERFALDGTTQGQLVEEAPSRIQTS